MKPYKLCVWTDGCWLTCGHYATAGEAHNAMLDRLQRARAEGRELHVAVFDADMTQIYRAMAVGDVE